MKRANENNEPEEADQGSEKRSRVDEQEQQGDAGSAPGNVPDSNDAAVARGDDEERRFLLDARAVGTVIGRSGSNIKKMRDDFKVFASISKARDGQPEPDERVLTLKGSATNIAGAVKMFAELLLEAQNAREAKADPSSTARTDTITVKMLINKLAAGIVIGRGGTVIKEIQAASKCRMQISPEVLGRSSEKSMSFIGTPAAIFDALIRAFTQLQQNPLKPGYENILFVPGDRDLRRDDRFAPRDYPPYPPRDFRDFARDPYRDPAAPRDFYAADPYGRPQPPYAAPYGYPPAAAPAASFSARPYGGAAPTPYVREEPAATQQNRYEPSPGVDQVQKVAIPTACAGSVIGKSGSVIADIRSKTRCLITIANPAEDAPHERVATIVGQPQGVAQAIQMIRDVCDRFPPSDSHGAHGAHSAASHAPSPYGAATSGHAAYGDRSAQAATAYDPYPAATHSAYVQSYAGYATPSAGAGHFTHQ